ncbi:MAG: urate hydroxylase PuuD, partial [Actinobacteria bacterium]|nr:urate hydroxylase PuuD [Actinomycetota bacterium]
MLGPHLSDWLHLGIRWLHVIAGVVWIGTSFYFVWLNNHVRESPDQPPGSEGELWAVHGGAFYRVMKYERPPTLPDTLHWFKWEAYTTWLSGFSLLVLIFYIDAPIFLIDPAKVDLSPWTAAAIGIATLVLGWIIYEAMSRSALLDNPVWYGVVSLILITGVAIGLSMVFSDRGAYIHVGALLGTLMAGNVFFIIIPAQRELVAAMEEGREPNVELGKHAGQRSLHNNYMTLPVLFIMISSHFPFTYGHERSWAVLGGLIVVGAAIRHWYN